MTFSRPTNETERLAALYRYKILDTPPEAAFDRITTLATRLFDLPIALVSLVDESRAWFKSCIGFDAREVPRDATLCSFAVLTNEPLIIPDTQQDNRFSCNPFVQSEPGIRFYAGAPLLTQEGFTLGTLCLLDTQPHEPLSAQQQATLIDLAAVVVDELELRLAAHKIAQVDAALLKITQGVATVTGAAFFDALVQHFARVLDVDYVYIGLVEGDAPQMMRTIATFAHGQIVDNLEYPLQDTPCREIIEQRKICCYPRNVQAQFPRTPLLKSLNVESYVAIPFFDSSGTPLGLLGVMDSKPMENMQLAESLLTIFGLRVATELERQQTDAALRKSEEKYRNLFNSMDEGYFLAEVIFDKQGCPMDFSCLEVNPAVMRITGLDLVGRQLHELDPKHKSYWWETLSRVAQTGVSERGELYAESMKSWYNFYIFNTDNADCRQVAAVFDDITKRKRAEQERERFLSVGSDLQVITGNNGFFQWVSPTFERTLGWTVDEMISHPWADFIHPDDIHLSVSETDSLFLGNETVAFENRYRHKDGSYRWFFWKAQPYPEEQVIYGAAVDITDRKQAEETLRESEELKQRILESSKDCIKVLTLNSEISYISPGGLNLLEIEEPTSILSTVWANAWQGEDYKKAKVAIAAATVGNTGQFQGYLPTAKGTPKWWDSIITPMRDAAGQVVQLVAISRDITEAKRNEAARQKTELALREAHIQLKSALAAGAIYTWRWNIQADRVVVDAALAHLFGVDSAVATTEGLPLEVFVNSIHTEDRPRVSNAIQQVIATGETFMAEYRVHNATGEEHWVAARGQVEYDAAGLPIAFPGALADITHRKQVEAALRESEERFRTLADNMSQFAWMADASGWIFWYNHRWFDYTGTTLAQMQGWGWQQVHHPEHIDRVVEHFRHHLEIGEEWEDTFPLRGKDGAYRWFLSRATPITDEAGQILRWFGTNTDITELKQAEASLQISEERLRLATEAADIGMWFWNLIDDQLVWTPYCKKLFGLAPDTVMSYERFLEALHPDDRDRTHIAVQQAIAEQQEYSIEYRSLWNDGSTHWIIAKGRAFYNKQNEPIRMMGIAQEITERKQAEVALQAQAHELSQMNMLLMQTTELVNQRNQELDQFAHIVSHDLKAPLRAISNLSQWIEEDLEDRVPPETKKHFDLLRSRVARMEALINGLLTYARFGYQDASKETFALNELLLEIVDSLAILPKFKIQIPPNLPIVTANRLLLSQVFSNLMSNAVKHHDRPDGQVKITAQIQAQGYKFAVSDDGPGIAPENHSKVFDIFQTLSSKERKENTGIGLAIIKKIIERKGGKIYLKSELGEGTTFIFTWPISQPDAKH